MINTEINWDEYLFRCSSLGHIMIDPKGKSHKQKYEECLESLSKKQFAYSETKNKETKTAKNMLEQLFKLSEKLKKLEPLKDVPVLSDGCKTHLCDLYTVVTTGRTRDIKNKYLEKGLLLEEDAITQYSLLTGTFFQKNKLRKYNEYVDGEMDFPDEFTAYDTKVSWDIFTFNRTMAKPILPLYHWQLDGYMWLYNKPKGRLVYTLLNTPEHLIQLEEKKLKYDLFGTQQNFDYAPPQEREMFDEACKELRLKMTYDDIPLKDKVITFDIERSEERIERIKQRVIDCRYFLNNITKLKTMEDAEDADELQEMVA